MEISKKYWCSVLVTSIGLLVMTYLFFGAYYASSATSMLSIAFQPTILNAEMAEMHLYLNFISESIFFLNNTFPFFYSYDAILCLFVVISTIVVTIIALSTFKSKWYYVLPALSVFYILFWMENVVFLDITRIAFILSFSALFLLIWNITNYNSDTTYYYNIFISCIIFLLGYLVRYEAAILILSLFLVLIAFKMVISRTSILDFLKVLTPVFLIAVVFYPKNDWMTSDKVNDLKLNEIDSYYVNIMNVGYYENRSNLSASELMKIEAIKREFLADKNQILDLTFLKNVTNNKLIQFGTLLNGKLNYQKLHELKELIVGQYILYFIIYIALLIFYIVTFLITSTNKFDLFLLLSFNVVIGSLVILITILYKMESRGLFPIIQFLFFSNVFLVKDKFRFNFTYHSILIILLYVVSIISITCNIVRINQRKNEHQENLQNVESVWSEINNRFKAETVIFGLNSLAELTYSKPFSIPYYLNIQKASKEVIAYDSHVFLLLSATYKKKIKNFCGSLSMKDFYEASYKKRDRIIHIYDAERISFFIKYLKVIHDVEVDFKRFEGYQIDRILGDKYYYNLQKFKQH